MNCGSSKLTVGRNPGRRTERFDSEEEESDVMPGNDRTANRCRDIVGVKRGILRCELGPRQQSLVSEIVAGVAVILVGTRLGGHRHLDGTGTAIVNVVGVALNGRFLDGVGVRGHVQYPGPDGTGDVQSVHNIHVPDGALAVRAGIDLGLGGVIIAARSRASVASDSQSSDARRQSDQ